MQNRYLNSEPRWVVNATFSLPSKAVDAYLAHHKGWATDLTKDRHSVLSIRSNIGLFLSRESAEKFTENLLSTLTARGTHRVVLIGKVRYLEPVGLDKPFIQPGLHSFSAAADFFQPSIVS